MDLTESQKKLIKKINDRKVVDLYTYITEFLEPEVFKYDIKEIEEKKRQDYEKSKKKIDDYLSRVKKIEVIYSPAPSTIQSEYSPNEIKQMKKELSDFKVISSDFEKK